MTRLEIETDMKNILERDDLTGQISIWFRRAHRAAQHKHNFLFMEKTAFTGVVEGQTQFEIPLELKNPIMLYTYNPFTGGSIRFFKKADIEEVRGERYGDIIQQGSVYAQWSNIFEIDPPIGADETPFQLRLDYHGYITPPEADGEDFLTEHGEPYLIYRGLRESAPFLGADTRLKMWAELEKSAWEDLYRTDIEARIAGGPLTMRG
jgi:hypothetical protein